MIGMSPRPNLSQPKTPRGSCEQAQNWDRHLKEGKGRCLQQNAYPLLKFVAEPKVKQEDKRACSSVIASWKGQWWLGSDALYLGNGSNRSHCY